MCKSLICDLNNLTLSQSSYEMNNLEKKISKIQNIFFRNGLHIEERYLLLTFHK